MAKQFAIVKLTKLTETAKEVQTVAVLSLFTIANRIVNDLNKYGTNPDISFRTEKI